MKKVLQTALSLLFLTAIISQTAAAQAAAAPAAAKSSDQSPAGQKITVHLDPTKTEIHWTLGGALHTVHGTFALKGGMALLDTTHGLAEGQMLVDADTGVSGDDKRDQRMKKEVLETGRYPEIFFHAAKLTGTLKPVSGPQQVMLEGMFNIHGADHPLQLPIKVEVSGTHLTASTHFVVPYVAWKMKDPSTFLLKVSKQVDVDVVTQGTIEGLEWDGVK